MKTIIFFLTTLLLVAACSTDDSQSSNPPVLAGQWQEIEPAEVIQLAGSNHLFEFSSDSFFVTIKHFTDASDPNDPCSRFYWTEYAAGPYEITSAIISFNGVFTDSLFNEISSGCWNVGKYNFTYPYTADGDTLILNPHLELYENERIKLVKEEDK